MDGYEVLRPAPDEATPEEDDFLLLFRNRRRIVLMMDDLTRYVASKTNLREFAERLGRHTSTWVVISTCRDGPELETRIGSRTSL
jgi:hypothetical protein